MAASIQDSCTKILNGVRNCSLNYSCQETPYSIYLTIRKSWSKHHQVEDLRDKPCESVQNVSDKLLETKVSDENVSLKNEMNKIEFNDVYLDFFFLFKVVKVFTEIMDIYEKKKD